MSVVNPGGRGCCQAQRDIEERNVLGLRAQAEGADAVGELEAVQDPADRAVGVTEQRDAQVVQVHSGWGVVDQVVHLDGGDVRTLRIAQHGDVVAALQCRDDHVVQVTDARVERVAETQIRLAGIADDRAKLLRRGQGLEAIAAVGAEVKRFDRVEVSLVRSGDSGAAHDPALVGEQLGFRDDRFHPDANADVIIDITPMMATQTIANST